MLQRAAQKAVDETTKLVQETNVLGKVVIFVVIGGLAGWFLAEPLFAIPEATYSATVSASLAVCGMSVVLFCVAVRNLQLVWHGHKPLHMKIPPVFNQGLVLAVAMLIGVTVSLSVFR